MKVSAQDSAGTKIVRWCRIRLRDESDEVRAKRLKRWPPRVVVVALVIVAVVLGINLYPHQIRVSSHPSVLDETFDSRTLILALRIVVLFAVGFIVASLIARIWGGQWLSKAGPFEITDVKDLTDELKQSEAQVANAQKEIETLDERLAKSDETIEELLRATEGLKLRLVESNTTMEALRAGEQQANERVTSLTSRLEASELVAEELRSILKAGGGPADDRRENDD